MTTRARLLLTGLAVGLAVLAFAQDAPNRDASRADRDPGAD
jgi:hypothetical protein